MMSFILSTMSNALKQAFNLKKPWYILSSEMINYWQFVYDNFAYDYQENESKDLKNFFKSFSCQCENQISNYLHRRQTRMWNFILDMKISSAEGYWSEQPCPWQIFNRMKFSVFSSSKLLSKNFPVWYSIRKSSSAIIQNVGISNVSEDYLE